MGRVFEASRKDEYKKYIGYEFYEAKKPETTESYACRAVRLADERTNARKNVAVMQLPLGR